MQGSSPSGGGTVREKTLRSVLITNELGYGVVPVDAFDRKYGRPLWQDLYQDSTRAKRVDPGDLRWNRTV